MLNRKFEIISKIFTIISIIAATIFLSTDLRPKWMLVGIISSGLLAIIIVLKYHFLIKNQNYGCFNFFVCWQNLSRVF